MKIQIMSRSEASSRILGGFFISLKFDHISEIVIEERKQFNADIGI